MAWIKRNGPLRSLEDILLIEGFSLRIADKFYKSMLGHVDETKGMYAHAFTCIGGDYSKLNK